MPTPMAMAAIATPINLDALIARIEANGGKCVTVDLGTACRPSSDRRAVDIAAMPGDTQFFRKLVARLGNPCGRPGRELGGWRNGRDIAVADQKTLFLSGANEPGLVPMVDSSASPAIASTSCGGKATSIPVTATPKMPISSMNRPQTTAAM